MRKISLIIALGIVAIAFFGCWGDGSNVVSSFVNDPFYNSMVKSQNFEIDGSKDNVVRGKKGTILVCPKGCFKNSKGKIVTDDVNIELAEALSVEDMLLSNLTTTANGKALETDGMIYFDATADGEKLSINKEIPVHIEIPTAKKKAGMEIYKGIRDKNGNMDWVEPKAIDNWLQTIDLDALDFLPKGFEKEVNLGMPYKNYKTPTKGLTDSLYYRLSVADGGRLAEGLMPTEYNEAYYNAHKKMVNGKYTPQSYVAIDSSGADKYEFLNKIGCGIDPAIIKVIKSKEYQKTLIATKEFELRLRTIFATCENDVLGLYINNLDKNLYEIDEMAAQLCKAKQKDDAALVFAEYAKLRLTKVKDADKYAQLLKGFYETQLKKVKADLAEQEKQLMQALSQKNKAAEEVIKAYQDLLFERETYRMETYGFELTDTGWLNVDRGTDPKTWGAQRLEIKIDNGAQLDRVHTYVIYKGIKSLYRLNSTDKKTFYVGNEAEREMLMPKNDTAVVIAIGYKSDAPFLAIKEFQTGSKSNFNLSLTPSTLDKINATIQPYNDYEKENDIKTDLEYMQKFYQEAQRQKGVRKEAEFLLRLWRIAFPCCAGEGPDAPLGSLE